MSTDTETEPVLTERDKELLEYLSRGHSRREIARLSHRAVGTVDKHVHSTIRKLQARNATHAVALAILRKQISHDR